SENFKSLNPDSSLIFQGSTVADSVLDDLLKNARTCTHTRPCSTPPGHDAALTHTRYQTHTQALASEEDDDTNNKKITGSRPRRPSGNRAAVRKYREKRKAHTAYLEEEVEKLRLLNQQRVRKLQGQAILEAEALRLKSFLLHLGGKIDNELGVFPNQKQGNTNAMLKKSDCGLQSAGVAISLRCPTNLPSFHPHVESSSQAGTGGSGKTVISLDEHCEPAITDCRASTNQMVNFEGQTLETVETLVSSASQAE
ncbi:basic leucine zipper 23-like, partial [Juglans microcarpa x Juglans regia]|uniref:basic leucine zipper 23-like n=1 Tax=Juglans microcarpa x Juglans regia TaxID=2249226 RepID=UPI001B7E3C51